MRPAGRADDYSGGRIERVDLSTGRIEVLYRECDGVPLNGPNDIVFDGKRGFWFTDLGKVYGRQMDRGAVYYARADGSLIREAVFPIITPNGVGLSPDGNTLYVAETETSRLWSFRIIGEGELEKQPWPSPHGGKLVAGLPGYQRFDSLAVEENGNVCVATLIRGGISVISPAGEWLEFHEAPEHYCTNLAFGGAGMRKAYVTLSNYGAAARSRLAASWTAFASPELIQGKGFFTTEAQRTQRKTRTGEGVRRICRYGKPSVFPLCLCGDGVSGFYL